MTHPITYRQKPTEVQAMQMPADDRPHLGVRASQEERDARAATTRALTDEVGKIATWVKGNGGRTFGYGPSFLDVDTVQGILTARPGEFVIHLGDGRFRLMSAREVEEHYEAVPPLPLAPNDFDTNWDEDTVFTFTETEDAVVMAYGHRLPRVFAAEVDEYDRITNAPGSPLIPNDPGQVRHRWAVRTTPNDEPEWRITWKDVGPDTPGAFPVTVLER